MQNFRTCALAVLLPAGLGGCALLPSLDTLLPASEPVTVARLYNDDVRVPAPNGFCVDKTASDLNTGFAIMAPCASMGESAASPRNSAIITAQVGAKGSAVVENNEATLAAFLETDAGAALLSPDEVAVKSTASSANDVRVAFEVVSEVAGTTGAIRRAFLDVGDRLVTLSVRSLTEAPLANTVARFMLADLVTATQRANTQRQETAE